VREVVVHSGCSSGTRSTFPARDGAWLERHVEAGALRMGREPAACAEEDSEQAEMLAVLFEGFTICDGELHGRLKPRYLELAAIAEARRRDEVTSMARPEGVERAGTTTPAAIVSPASGSRDGRPAEPLTCP
jgi:hypothetical protein